MQTTRDLAGREYSLDAGGEYLVVLVVLMPLLLLVATCCYLLPLPAAIARCRRRRVFATRVGVRCLVSCVRDGPPRGEEI